MMNVVIFVRSRAVCFLPALGNCLQWFTLGIQLQYTKVVMKFLREIVHLFIENTINYQEKHPQIHRFSAKFYFTKDHLITKCSTIMDLKIWAIIDNEKETNTLNLESDNNIQGLALDNILFAYKDYGIVPFDRASDDGVLFLVWWATIVTQYASI